MSMTTKGAPLFRGNPPRFVGYKGTGPQKAAMPRPRWHKEDYKLMAAAIRDARMECRGNDERLRGIAEVMATLIHTCKQDNARFEELWFIAACTKGEADEG